MQKDTQRGSSRPGWNSKPNCPASEPVLGTKGNGLWERLQCFSLGDLSLCLLGIPLSLLQGHLKYRSGREEDGRLRKIWAHLRQCCLNSPACQQKTQHPSGSRPFQEAVFARCLSLTRFTKACLLRHRYTHSHCTPRSLSQTEGRSHLPGLQALVSTRREARENSPGLLSCSFFTAAARQTCLLGGGPSGPVRHGPPTWPQPAGQPPRGAREEHGCAAPWGGAGGAHQGAEVHHRAVNGAPNKVWGGGGVGLAFVFVFSVLGIEPSTSALSYIPSPLFTYIIFLNFEAGSC